MNQAQVISLSRSRHERGGVLLFAVIILSVLIVIAATFMATTRQARSAAINSVNSTMAGVAAEAAKNDAQRVIRWSLTSHSICTPDGVFDAAAPNYLDTAHGTTLDPSIGVNPFRYFEVTPADFVEFPDGALLYFDAALTYNNSSGAASPPSAYYTTSPLAIHAYPSGQMRTGASGLQHDDTARKNELKIAPGFADDFNFASPNVQKLKQIGGLRGEYYVWVADLDAKLHGVTQDWGIDTLNTLDPRLDQLLGGPSGGAYDPDPTLAQAAWNNALQQGALAWLNDYGNGIDPSSGWGYLGGYNGLQLNATDIGLITGTAANTRLRTVNAFALKLPTLADPLAAYYLPERGAVDHYFTVFPDQPNKLNPLPMKFCKDYSTALNINTATPEVIAAALSQIPAETDGETLGSAKLSRPLLIARRIVAKRPFLCRMDFEDYLAAQIRGTTYDPDKFTAYTATLPPDTDPVWTDASLPVWMDISGPPTAYVIYFGVGRRPGIGSTVDITDNIYLINQDKAELTLSQYLELPGVVEDAPAFKRVINDRGVDKDAWPNHPLFQRNRFRYFFDEPTRAAAEADGSLITAKEFNNIINSVTSIYVNDDVQDAFPTVLPPAIGAAGIVVSAGADGAIQTTPQGDDVYDDKLNPTKILAGPNGIAETWTSANRPSYFSYSNDLAALEQFWDVTMGSNFTSATTKPVEENALASTIRVYWRLREDKPATSLPPGQRLATEITDLMSWRALPKPNLVALDVRLSGFYQVSFDGDDWTFGYSSANVNDYGALQSLGDAALTENYSTAKVDSGTIKAPNVTGNGDVSWSPQFAFRSRFYAIYVLGRGLQKNDADPNPPRVTGEVRMEAVYDALEDRTLWTRTQLSDKRALGEP